MLYGMDRMSGMVIGASDGEIGKLKDLYFDDARWAVRHLVVDAGGWLENRQVLVSPRAVERIDWEQRRVEVRLSCRQVRGSPHIDSAMPVSRQHELDLFRHYGYPDYWGGPLLWGATAYPFFNPAQAPLEQTMAEQAEPAEPADPHLRSGAEVAGYHIEATDGAIGHIKDFLVEDRSWAVRYIVVDTRNWWPGRQVVIPPAWITCAEWAGHIARINVDRAAVKSAPAYDPAACLTREYEEALHRHYARQGYWAE